MQLLTALDVTNVEAVPALIVSAADATQRFVKPLRQATQNILATQHVAPATGIGANKSGHKTDGATDRTDSTSEISRDSRIRTRPRSTGPIETSTTPPDSSNVSSTVRPSKVRFVCLCHRTTNFAMFSQVVAPLTA